MNRVTHPMVKLSGGLVLVLSVPTLWAESPASRPADFSSAPAITIYRDPARYDSFPDIKRLPDNRLLCVFRDATMIKPIRHIEPDARIVGCLSTDNGLTWSKPVVVYDDPACQNDPSVAVLGDGRLLLTFFNWMGRSADYVARHPSAFSRKVSRGQWGAFAEPGGVYRVWGDAKALTWDKEATHVTGDAQFLQATSAAVLETREGTLLMPTYGSTGKNGPDGKRLDGAFVLRSTDHGKTWGKAILIANDPKGKVAMHEPALVQTPSGAVVALMRTANADDHLYMTRSTDDGKTWAPAEATELVGHPPDLLVLPDQQVLAVYGYRHDPFGVRGCLSSDDGRTWSPDRQFIIARNGVQGDLGYPSVCLTADQHIVVVYYMNGKDTNDRWIECKRIPLAKLKF